MPGIDKDVWPPSIGSNHFLTAKTHVIQDDSSKTHQHCTTQILPEVVRDVTLYYTSSTSGYEVTTIRKSLGNLHDSI